MFICLGTIRCLSYRVRVSLSFLSYVWPPGWYYHLMSNLWDKNAKKNPTSWSLRDTSPHAGSKFTDVSRSRCPIRSYFFESLSAIMRDDIILQPECKDKGHSQVGRPVMSLICLWKRENLDPEHKASQKLSLILSALVFRLGGARNILLSPHDTVTEGEVSVSSLFTAMLHECLRC